MIFTFATQNINKDNTSSTPSILLFWIICFLINFVSDEAGEIYTWISLPVKGAQTHYFFSIWNTKILNKACYLGNTSKYEYTKNWKLLKAKFPTYISVIYYLNIPDETAIYDLGIVLAKFLECAMILKIIHLIFFQI